MSISCTALRSAILTSFFFPMETLFGQSRYFLHGQKDIAMLAKRLAACIRLSTTVSQLFEPQLQKIAIFTYPGLHFFALGTPLWQSRKTLHEWKDNSMLAEPLAAYTHLSSTVSQLFEPRVQKIAVFTYFSPHFCFPWRRPCNYHAIFCMDGKTIQCLPNPSQHVPIYLQ